MEQTQTSGSDVQQHFEKLSPEEQTKARERFERFVRVGAINPNTSTPFGWRKATGPVHDRDFHGRTTEDYKKIYHANRRSGASHEEALQHVQGMRKKAQEEGLAAIRTGRAEHLRGERNARNLSAADQIKRDTRESTELFHAAMGAAGKAHEYFNNATQSVDKLSPEATKHLSSITRMARQTIHDTVIGGLRKVSGDFVKHAQDRFTSSFSGVRPSDFGYSKPHDIVPSLIRPHRVQQMLRNYADQSWGREPREYVHDLYQPPGREGYDPGGTDVFQMHNAASHIGELGDIHPFAAHLNLGASHRTSSTPSGMNYSMHHFEDIIGHHMVGHRSLAGTSDTPHEGFSSEWTSSSRINAYKFSPEHGKLGTRVDAEKRKDVDQTVRSGMHRVIAHIWAIPNLSRSDRRNLMKHFEVQMRHHNVAAMANPRMYAEHHAGKAAQEAEAAARQQGQARERARQRASAGGSGEAPPPRSRWPHPEQPHEILGISSNAGPDEIRRAYRKLSIIEHPDHKVAIPDVWKTIDPKHHESHQSEMRRLFALSKKLREISDNSTIDIGGRLAAAKKREETDKQIEELKKARELIEKRHIESPAGQEIMKKYQQERGIASSRFSKITDAHDHMMRQHGINESVIMMLAEWITKRYKK